MVKRTTMMAQLASVSEGALGKLASSDLSKSALQGALVIKDRVERLVMGMTELDERVDALEKRVAALEKPKRRAPARKTTAASPAKKKPASTTAKSRTSSTGKTASS